MKIEISPYSACFRFIDILGFLFCRIAPEGSKFSHNMYFSLPAVFKRSLHIEITHPSAPRFVSAIPLRIGHILLLSGLAQIAKGVVGLVAINVIDARRNIAMNIKPCYSMAHNAPLVDNHDPVSACCSVSGHATYRYRWNRFNFPRYCASSRVVIKEGSDHFLGHKNAPLRKVSEALRGFLRTSNWLISALRFPSLGEGILAPSLRGSTS